MAAEFLRTLVVMALTSSIALVMVRLLRKPLRAVAGARVAYGLWVLVPAMTLAVLLPAPTRMLLPPTAALPAQIQAVLEVAVRESTSWQAVWSYAALAIWAAGAALMSWATVHRQRAFARSLGSLHADARGIFRGARITAPMLIGVWRPRIVVPMDFDSRYTPTEQALVLAHERAHARRGDLAVNLLGSVTLCVFWFNPLVYRALTWLRMDQELACDAQILAPHAQPADNTVRRAYADALLKTQLASESAWRAPVGCHWQSNHPLKERILMLKRPLPGFARRLAGVGLVLGLTTVAAYSAWAGQSDASGQGLSILVDLKMIITNTQSNEVRALASRYLVHSGEEIKDGSGKPLDFACTPFLPDEPGRTTDWTPIRARGIPVPSAGQILVTCSVRQDGSEVAKPAIIMADGVSGAIETGEMNGPHRYRLEVTATTSTARIAEASRAAPNKN